MDSGSLFSCVSVFLTQVQFSPADPSNLCWKPEVRKSPVTLSFILHFNDGSTALLIFSTDIPYTALREK